MQNQQVKKSDSIQFECKTKDHQCWAKNKGVVKICSWSPCPLNLYEFFRHGRIIEYYTDNEEWDEAYYYFDNLLSKLPISCDLDELKKNPNNIDLPPGCKVFKESFELKDIKRTLKRYQKTLKNGEISEQGEKIYNDLKLKFDKKIQGNLERLKHLAKDKQVKKQDSDEYHQKLLNLYDKAIEAAKKYGLKVQDSLGTALEKGFEKAAQGSGLETQKHAEINKERTKKAKLKMEKNKLIEKIRNELSKNGELSSESLEKLKEFEVD